MILLLRILAKHAARDMGAFVLWFIVAAAVIAGCALQSWIAVVVGATIGLFIFTLPAVVMPMASSEMTDLGATGRRFMK
jgi:beta-lactamase regulating signal transducer with metallopeptidase domain